MGELTGDHAQLIRGREECDKWLELIVGEEKTHGLSKEDKAREIQTRLREIQQLLNSGSVYINTQHLDLAGYIEEVSHNCLLYIRKNHLN